MFVTSKEGTKTWQKHRLDAPEMSHQQDIHKKPRSRALDSAAAHLEVRITRSNNNYCCLASHTVEAFKQTAITTPTSICRAVPDIPPFHCDRQLGMSQLLTTPSRRRQVGPTQTNAARTITPRWNRERL